MDTNGHTATPEVQVMDEQFEMPQLGTSRRVWLYLPRRYQNSSMLYPVIYMQDGQNLFDEATASFDEWRIDEYLSSLTSESQAIVVGVDHAGADRIFEYNPYDTVDGPGRGNQYAAFLVETLKPFIDQNYRTLSDARHTTVAGSSLGGLIAMYSALKYPNIFGNAGIFSPAFWISRDVYTYASAAKGLERSHFYFACGDAESQDMVSEVIKMIDILKNKNLSSSQICLQIVEAAGHNEAQWQQDFPAFYSWLIGNSNSH